MKTLTPAHIPPSRLYLYALPSVPGIQCGRGRVGEHEFRELIERIAGECWELTREHIRGEFDSQAAIDPRVPRRWTLAPEADKQRTRVQVLAWWNGADEVPTASTVTHVCRAIVLEYKRQWEASR